MTVKCAIVIALFAIGCNELPPPKDYGLELARSIATEALVDIQKALQVEQSRTATPDPTEDGARRAAGVHDSGFGSCAVASAVLTQLREAGSPLAGAIDRLCNYDLPLAELSATVATVEADKMMDDRGRPTSCWWFWIDSAHERLSKPGTLDPTVEALVSRYRARCGR